MISSEPQTMSINRIQTICLGIGLTSLVVSIAGGYFVSPQRFFQSYLFAFLFWLGISLGSLAILLLHHLVGSRWGLTIRRILEASASMIGLLAILFIPVVFGVKTLYPWADPDQVAASSLLQHKSLYLNTPFFLIRALLYFGSWITLAFLANRWAASLSVRDDPNTRVRLRNWGAFGLILYTLTMSFASIDWVMSIEPFWSSTIFGLMLIIAQVMTGLAFGLVMINLIPDYSLGRKWSQQKTPLPYKDLGALLLVLVMGWAYLAYFQLLIIWAGNIPREVTWYLNRTEGGWLPVGILLVIFQFAIPFLMLISTRSRHNLRVLAGLGGLMLFSHLVNMYWQVIPAYSPGQFSLHWLDILLPAALGGIWMWGFLYFLRRRPSLPETDQAVLDEAVQLENAATD